MIRPRLNPPRLNDPFWILAAMFVIGALAFEGYRYFADSAADRERLELVRDGD
jgi:hypothetical protein